ncbi:hypothetical protein [Piscirickettsia litoralis]|uniref:Uncharacterized protein n=1 Tax=Piscirickettsia litoralis TaxID=1891921 RepID=A0ABX2ZY25_9GAMM|nr:hypothetical protein [Piscirickettsia litoralis]ODN41477.1 hypothetical protein BGC07_15290 [Piscirickettsia litoralis]
MEENKKEKNNIIENIDESLKKITESILEISNSQRRHIEDKDDKLFYMSSIFSSLIASCFDSYLQMYQEHFSEPEHLSQMIKRIHKQTIKQIDAITWKRDAASPKRCKNALH